MEDLNVDTQSLLNEGYAFFTEEIKVQYIGKRIRITKTELIV